MGYGQGHELQDKTKSKIWKIIQRGNFFIGESRDAESFERELGRRIPSGEIPGVGSVTSSLLEKNDLCHISSDARWLPSAFDIFADISPSVFFWCDLYIYFRETIVCRFFLSVWGVCVCYRRWTSQTDLDDAGPSTDTWVAGWPVGEHRLSIQASQPCSLAKHQIFCAIFSVKPSLRMAPLCTSIFTIRSIDRLQSRRCDCKIGVGLCGSCCQNQQKLFGSKLLPPNILFLLKGCTSILIEVDTPRGWY